MLARLLADPAKFLTSPPKGLAMTKLVRQVGAHVQLSFQEPNSAHENVQLMHRVAQVAACPCSQSYAHRLEGSWHVLAGRYNEAHTSFDQDKCGCRYCTADKLWRVVSLKRNHAASGAPIEFNSVLAEAKKAVEYVSELEARARRGGSTDLGNVLACLLGRCFLQSGITSYVMEDFENAKVAAYKAMELTTPPPGKIAAYRWWGRVVPCPSLPTAELRDIVNQAAFINYVLFLSLIPDDRPEARNLVQLLDKSKLCPERKAKLTWLKGMLMIDDWMEAKEPRAKQSIREASERHLRQAMLGLLDCKAPAVDVVACICDRAQLPWRKNPARFLQSVLKKNGRYSVEQIEGCMKALHPDLYDDLMAATFAGRTDDAYEALGRLRQVATRNRAWPSFMPQAA